MSFLPIRLSPGTDLRRALEALPASHGTDSAFVVAGIGSLVRVSIRYADAPDAVTIAGPLEIVSLSGSLSAAGAHLHVSVSDVCTTSQLRWRLWRAPRALGLTRRWRRTGLFAWATAW
jgi:predicted DNA-binding protein with PD1-like motif